MTEFARANKKVLQFDMVVQFGAFAIGDKLCTWSTSEITVDSCRVRGTLLKPSAVRCYVNACVGFMY